MKLSIGFTGDIAFSEYNKDFYNKPYNIDSKIYDFLNSNDYNILNFESPITDSKISYKNALCHKSNPDSLKFIKTFFKHVILNLANNHIMDYDLKGMKDTLNNIKNEDIPFIGAGLNLNEAFKYHILGDEVKVGILAFQYKDYKVATSNTPGTAHEKEEKIIKEKLKELKQKVNWIVIIYHGGEEFYNLPSPEFRKKVKKFLSWGADIIVAHHPHTVQGYEKIKNKMIFYSLGNFIFDTNFQRYQEGTDQGLLLKLDFTKDSYDFKTLAFLKDRKENKLISIEKNNNFFDINCNYKEKWLQESKRLSIIDANKKEFREYRKKFLMDDLLIQKTNAKNVISFTEFINKNKKNSEV